MTFKCPDCGSNIFYRKFNFYNYYEFENQGDIGTEHSPFEAIGDYRCRECDYKIENEKAVKKLNEIGI